MPGLLDIISILLFSTPQVAQDRLLVVTNQNRALIDEKRLIKLEKEQVQLSLEAVSDQINPVTVSAEGYTDFFEIISQQFLNQPLTSEQLRQKTIGHEVKVKHSQLGEFYGTVLHWQGSELIMVSGGSVRIITFNDETTVDLPDDLLTDFRKGGRLLWNIKTIKHGEVPLRLTYVTEGLRWEASYNAILNDKEDKMAIDGWATVSNNTNMDFGLVSLKLLAGDLQTVEIRNFLMVDAVSEMRAPMAGAPAQEESFHEYHLYHLQEKQVIPANQEIQVRFIKPAVVDVVKKYLVSNHHPEAVHSVITFKNDKKSGLGEPLPGGVIRMFSEKGTTRAPIGEDFISHTPKDKEVELTTGTAFDISSERIEQPVKNLSRRSRQEAVVYTLHNSRSEAVQVQVDEYYPDYQLFKLNESSHEMLKHEAGRISFILPIPAGGEAKLTFEYTVSW